MEKDNLKKAVSEWKKLLGDSRVIDDPEELRKIATNEIACPRKIPAILKPVNTEEVAAIVKLAGTFKVPLYPVSTGNNWGYGGPVPVIDDCVIIDLSQMDGIIWTDRDLGLITVQPGVTPKKLRDYLDKNDLRYLVPVSGAGPYCSLIGNALERGYGVTPIVDHFGAVTSIEAVLPDGEIYRPALKSMGGKIVDAAFKWGIGPYVDGLFSQGAFGIVTEMTLALAPIPEKIEIFMFGLKNDSLLEDAVLAVREILKTAGNVTGSINLMNSQRVLSMVEEYPREKVKKGGIIPEDLVDKLLKKNYLGCWTVGGIIYGESRLVASTKKIIRKRAGKIAGKLMFFSRRKINFLVSLVGILPDFLAKNLKKQLANLDESFKVAEGAPSEIALPLCYWKNGIRPPKGQMMNPAKDGCGIIWYSPLIPMKPEDIRLYTEYVKKICISKGIEPLITLTSLSHRCFDSTVPILFDPKNPDETARAKECYLELYRAGKKLGFLPYRMGIDHMDLLTKEDSSFFSLVAKLKRILDPDDIIAPGRYCKSPRS